MKNRKPTQRELCSRGYHIADIILTEAALVRAANPALTHLESVCVAISQLANRTGTSGVA